MSGARVTITDLARELSLSVCTINKALTGKPRITEATRQRVVEAANRLGYKPNPLARSMGRSVIKLATIYPNAWPSHTKELFEGVKERLAELRDYRVEASFKIIPDFTDGRAFLRALREIAKDGTKGVIFSFGDYSAADTSAILQALSATGIPHVALGNAAQGEGPLLSSVWQDCQLCGHLAGELLSFALPPKAKTAIFIGRREHPDHSLKIQGFSDALKGQGLRLPEVCEAFDDPKEALPAAKRLFQAHPDIAGLYIGTENVLGILDYLEKSGRKGKVKVVATGISEPVAKGIRTGLVQASIHQRQRFQGRLAVNTLFNLLETGVKMNQETLVAPQILFPGNFAEAE